MGAYALLAPCAPGGGVRARRSGMHFAISRPRTRTCRPRSDIWSTTWARGTRQKGFVPPRTGTHWYLANCVPRSYEGAMCGHAGPAVVFGCCRAWLCVQGLLALHFSQHLAGTPPWVCSEVGAPTSSGNHALFGCLVVAWVPAPGVTPPVVCSVGAPTLSSSHAPFGLLGDLLGFLLFGPALPPLSFPCVDYVQLS